MTALSDAARAYAERGFHVLPLYGIVDGHCTCHKGPDCENGPGKHPKGKAWQTRPAEPPKFFDGQGSRANIGLAPRRSGHVVIDVDSPQGEEALARIMDGEPLPPGPEASTRRGRHLWFTAEGIGACDLGADLELKTENVVVAPSRRIDGGVYAWTPGRSLLEVPVPPLPERLRAAAEAAGNGGARRGEPAPGEPIPQGKRNKRLHKIGCHLRGNGFAEPTIVAALREENRTRCKPPLSDEEVVAIAHQAATYAPGEPDEAEAETEPNGAAPGHDHQGEIERGELLLARRFVAEHGEDFRNVPGLGWHRWSGAAWRLCDLGEQVEAAKATAQRMSADAPRRASSIFGALRLAESDPAVAVPAEALDADPYLLGTPAGVVDLRTGELREARRDDLLTHLTACGPAEEVGGEWAAFLATVQPDEEARTCLQRLRGRALVGQGTRALVVDLGDGGNGKTQAMVAIGRVLGDYFYAAPLALLMADPRRSSGGIHPEQVALRGRRLVSVCEPPEGGVLSVERVKALTGGDPITARNPYGQLITFWPSHTVFLTANHAPRVPDAGRPSGSGSPSSPGR